MARKKHPKSEIEKVLKYAEKKGWKIDTCGAHAHAWGIAQCPYNDNDCRCGEFCQFSIWSTPRKPENFAKQIRQKIDHCIHLGEELEE